ncbi:agmatinase [Candidatus Micrarchaeum sp.]|jgi:agmatinase|uniref:agmatinase n=1 Tax=Candidatus Micrarchaeum sp. TaxID=2282148 RepID=UPI000929824D|nr:agmatinase [Candidatus Micrarchaeum sp.]OJI06739.1 MAG: agmatinase [Candidatus Micrarchaeum sp. ARMAN-1]OWP53438.1 MAG: agmatinase [Thermoplasmatales archaeon ARMAN]QRF73800.1 agmatinase [Candidatus Micrarchaeum sp.]
MQILNSAAPYNLFGLEDQSYEKAKFVVLPVPYDSTMSYGSGSRDGPDAIIRASRHIELYSEELGFSPADAGIYTLEQLEPDVSGPEAMVKRIAREVSIIIDDGKVPLLLGGEHTVALGAVMAIANAGDDFSVLHFDAHSDSREEFMNSKYSHACVMARIRDMCKSTYSVGVRSIDEQGYSKYSKDILYMKDMRSMSDKMIAESISKHVKKNVYITIDLDVLDPSEMPSVGTPEPGGMRYTSLINILSGVLKGRKLIGADISELAPIPGIRAPDYLAAKLAYELVGMATLGTRK